MDFTDILIIALAAVGAIISGITKSVRKKHESAQPANPTYEQWTQEDGDENEEYREIVSPQGIEMPYTLETESSAHWSHDRQAMVEIESLPQANDKYRQKRTTQHTKNSGYSSNEKKVEKVSYNDITENINIRDAIIYSELLKPKFKEY